MKRQGRPKDAASISLFPFLAVLICTMGALILLLVAIARQSKIQADRAAEVAANSRGATDLERARDLIVARIDFMREENGRTHEQLSAKRASLAQAEAELRQMKDKLLALDAAKADLDRMSSSGAGLSQTQRDELEKIKTRLAESRGKLDSAKKQFAAGGESYSIVPYDGPNATRRRPLYIECNAEGIFLQPEGVRITESDFEGPTGPGNPLAAGLRAACDHLDRQRFAGRGEAGEPYPLLLVRPDGVLNYHLARQALRSWGSDFGYELIEQDWKVDFKQPDPQLLTVETRAVEEARSRQRQLAVLLGGRGGGGSGGGGTGRGPYRAGGGGNGPWRPGDQEEQGPTSFTLSPTGGGLAPIGGGSRGGSGPRRGIGGATRDGLVGGTGTSRAGGGSPSLQGSGGGGNSVATSAGGSPRPQREFEFQNYGPELPGEGGGESSGAAGTIGNSSLAGGMSGGVPGGAGAAPGGTNGTGLPGGTGMAGSAGGEGASSIAGGSGGNDGQPGGLEEGGSNDLAAGGSSAGQAGQGGGGQQNASGGQAGAAGGAPAMMMGGQPSPFNMGQSSPGGENDPSVAGGGQSSAGGSGRVPVRRPAGVGSAVATDQQLPQGPAVLPQQLYGQRKESDMKAGNDGPATGSVAESMGKNWALPESAPRSFPVTRPIRIELRQDRLTLLPEPGSGKSPRVVKLLPRTRDSIDPLVSAVWDHMNDWGIAGKGLYWRPTLNIEFAPEAAQRMSEIRALLADSGLTLNEREAKPHKPLNAGRTSTLSQR